MSTSTVNVATEIALASNPDPEERYEVSSPESPGMQTQQISHEHFDVSAPPTQDINLTLMPALARQPEGYMEHTIQDETPPNETDIVMAASAAADSEVPDGGYGWVILAGCSTLTFWFAGTTYSWGVMQAALVREGFASPSTLAFVGSLTVACIAAFALINARVVRYLGARWSGMLGIGFMGLGEVLASFSTHSVAALFVTEGIIMGIGASLCFMTSSVTPAQWFKRRRGLANGIVYAGGGLGGTLISFVMNAINERLSVEWTFRIIGLLMLGTGLPLTYLVRDRVPQPRSKTWIEWALFRDHRFTTLFLCGLIATFPLFVPVFFIPLYAESFGISSLGGAGLVAAFQFASFFGRLGAGFIADKAGALNTLVSSLVLNVVSMLAIWPVATSLGPLAVFVILNGGANGAFFATMPTVVGNIFGSARVAVALGMVVTAWTGGYLLGAPIAGYILDSTGNERDVHSYLPSIFYAGSLSALALAFSLMTRFSLPRGVSSTVQKTWEAARKTLFRTSKRED